MARLKVEITHLNAEYQITDVERYVVEEASVDDLQQAFPENAIVAIEVTGRKGRLQVGVTEEGVVDILFVERNQRVAFRPVTRPSREQLMQLLERFLARGDRDRRIQWRWVQAPRVPGQPIFSPREIIELVLAGTALFGFLVWSYFFAD